MFEQQCGRLRVDGYPPLLSRLRLLLLDAGLGLGVGPLNEQRRCRESTCCHRRALISPRRMPVIMTTQRSRPQSGSLNAARMTAAASSALGGSGSVWLAVGATAKAAGFTPRWRQRTACSIAPLMM